MRNYEIKNYPLVLDFSNYRINKNLLDSFIYDENDTNTAVITVELKNKDKSIDLSVYDYVTLNIKKNDGITIAQQCKIIDKSNGIVEIIFSKQALLCSGLNSFQIALINEESQMFSPKVFYRVEEGVLNDSDIVSSDEYSVLMILISQYKESLKELKDLKIKIENLEITILKNEELRDSAEQERIASEIIRKDQEITRQNQEIERQKSIQEMELEIDDKITDIQYQFDEKAQQITDDINETKDNLIEDITNTKDNINQDILTTKTDLINSVNSAKETLITEVTTAKTDLTNSFNETKDNVIADISTTKNDLINSINSTKETLTTEVTTAKTDLVDSVNTSKDTMENKVQEAIDAIPSKEELKGKDGLGLEIKGSVDTVDQLPTDPTISDTYFVGYDLYIYDGAEWKIIKDLRVKGDKGDTGLTGKNIEFIWDNTQLGIRQEGSIEYVYVNLKGDAGEQGLSPYDLAKLNGFEGTELEWLNSLKGLDGSTPSIGENGNWFIDNVDTEQSSIGLKGDKGDKGDIGITGKSAYDVAIENGFKGTKDEWLLSLKGDEGDTPLIGENGNWFINGEDTGKQSKGDKGDIGSGLEIKGSFDTVNELPSEGIIGDAYLVQQHLYVWDNIKKWIDCGIIQGPPGKDGASTWVDILDKPETFNPTKHTHLMSDITGLKLDADTVTYNNKISNLNSINVQKAIDELKGIVDSKSDSIMYTKTVEQNEWKLTNDLYSIEIPHNLSSKNLFISILNNDTNINLISSYKIIDIDTIEIYNDEAINATVVVLGNSSNVSYIPVIGDNGNWFINNIDTKKSSVGITGDKGDKGEQGDIGLTGDTGKSAYEIALEDGFVGSKDEWLLSLKGEEGITPTIGYNGNWFLGNIDTGKISKGEKGDVGAGLEIKGAFDTVEELPQEGNTGDAYLIQRHLYIWDNIKKWVDCGIIQGEKGENGTSNWEDILNKPDKFNPSKHIHAMDDIEGLKLSADTVTYNNETSNLKAVNVQKAIDELKNEIDTKSELMIYTQNITLDNWLEKDDLYYIEINHNLSSKNLFISILNIDTNINLITSYKIINDNTINIYNDTPVNANVLVISDNININYLPTIGENGNWFLGDTDTGKSSIGKTGSKGDTGKSAYEIALEDGFVGSKEDWLLSLKGNKGDKGDVGNEGKTAYDVALEEGFVGTKEDWLNSLKGNKGDIGITGTNGDSAYEIALKSGFSGNSEEWLISLKGDKGDIGVTGKSAYEIASENGFLGNITEWLSSLKGDKGDSGVSNWNDISGKPSSFNPSVHNHGCTSNKSPTSGYISLGSDLGGLIIEWTQIKLSFTGADTKRGGGNLPIAFPNACIGLYSAISSAGDNACFSHGVAKENGLTSTKFGYHVKAVGSVSDIEGSLTLYILAIGY
ncbi:TPA: BppU family phage baseplate upper protein [Clostridioides difficile]